jgi:hypothetical protein
MTFSKWVAVAVTWVVSLVVVAWAQGPGGRPGSDEPTVVVSVIEGDDIGFRVESWNDNVPVGRWVVRSPVSGGRWVEPISAISVRPATPQ